MRKQKDLFKIFKVLGDETRFRIVDKLLNCKSFKDNTCCSDLADFTQKDLSTISRQLDILEKEGIIVVNKVSKSKCIKLKNKEIILKVFEYSKKL
ncbi:MAG: winged helix-turn-helix domain-containing protein [Candidatus ainarchaeum sp.]|nr:winged helix-turn-helix domain-containing protein [Candidatus ainarchaeum sp.]MDD3976190.1 winged helix-turn-helix domain-containing protein [Candidatus ainarchaeum sp.]